MHTSHRSRTVLGAAVIGVGGLTFALVTGPVGGSGPASRPVADSAPGFTVHPDASSAGNQGAGSASGAPGALGVGGGSGSGSSGGAGAAGSAGGARDVIDYLGHAFTVPASWPIVDLAKNPSTCVRFDTSVVYLGTPGTQEDCPASGAGRSTEAMLIQPSAGAPATSIDNTTSRQVSTIGQGVRITASYATDYAQIAAVIRSAGLPAPIAEAHGPIHAANGTGPGNGVPVPTQSTPIASAGGATTGPNSGTNDGTNDGPSAVPTTGTKPKSDMDSPSNAAGIAEDTRSYTGLGFDTCTAPTTAQMTAWGASPYQAIGIYFGGADRDCLQPALTAAWVQAAAQAGWHLLPLYIGPQVVNTNPVEVTAPTAQGTAAADDAIAQAQALGIGDGAVLYYDMEVGSTPYTPDETTASDEFLAAWTTELHRLGFLSGLYGNEGGSIGAQVAGWNSLVEPDVIDVGNWNGLQDDDPGADPDDDWNGRRVHQFVGDATQTFGGVQMAVDEDYFGLTAVGPLCNQPPPTSTDNGKVHSGPIICNNPQVNQ